MNELKVPLLDKKTNSDSDRDLQINNFSKYNLELSINNEKPSPKRKSTKRLSISKKAFVVDDKITFHEAFLNICKSSFPSILTLMFLFINDTVNLIFAGKYFSSDEISAIGLGTFYVNCIGFILGIGILGGVDTIGSQAFGAKQYNVVGLFVNIAKICLLAYSFLFIIPAVFLCEYILEIIKQDEVVIQLTSAYIKSLIPYIIFSLQYNANSRYLQSMNILFPGMVITMITSMLHSVWIYILTRIIDLGIKGFGYSMGITSILNFILITCYIEIYKPFPETKLPFTKECFELKRIYDFLKLAIPSAFQYASDWLGFEIIILLSSYINKASLAANVILFTFISLIGTIPLGLSQATTTLIGNSIGASKPRSAGLYSAFSCGLGVFVVLMVAIIIQMFKDVLPYIYTNDPNVARIISGILGIYILFGAMDALQVILSGVIKGLGKQKSAFMLVIVILYPVNIPLCLTFAFVMNYGLEGLWMSQLTAITLLAFSYLILIICVDWENIILRTIVRIKFLNENIKNNGGKLQDDNLMKLINLKTN